VDVRILVEYGGAISLLLIVLAFVGLVVAVERMLFFQHTKLRTADLLLGVTNHVRKKAFAEAMHEVSRARGPIARVVHTILMRNHLDRTNLREVAYEAGALEIPRIERNMRTLLGVALLAPLLGMFGTILGFIEVFMSISDAQTAVPQVAMANGLFRSLVSTAMGLAIAIPMYLLYLYLLGKGKRLLHRIERAGIEAVNIVCDAREQDRIVSFRQEVQAQERVSRKREATD